MCGVSLTDAGECVRMAIWWSNEKNMREVNGITLIRVRAPLPQSSALQAESFGSDGNELLA